MLEKKKKKKKEALLHLFTLQAPKGEKKLKSLFFVQL